MAENAIFRHLADESNTFGPRTTLDDRFLPRRILNNNPRALVTVTQRMFWAGRRGTDSGAPALEREGSGRYNPHYVAIEYLRSMGRWAIVNTDGYPLPYESAFDISVWSEPWNGGFVHAANSANTFGHTTAIDHPTTNGRPDAILIVTPSLNGLAGLPDGSVVSMRDLNLAPILSLNHSQTAGRSHALNHPIGVWYNESTGRWNIFNEDRTGVVLGAQYRVEDVSRDVYPPAGDHVRIAVSDGLRSSVHFAQESNDRRLCYFVTHTMSFWAVSNEHFGAHRDRRDLPARYFPHPVGAWWEHVPNTAAVFSEDGAIMQAGVAFNVRHY